MLSSQHSTSQILSTLNDQQPLLLEWFGDGFGLHIQVGDHKQFVTFRIGNVFNNINWAGTALASFLAFSSVGVVDAVRYYGMNPSRWFKLFFKSGETAYQYEGPYVGIYREIVQKLEHGLCGADINMPGFASFSYYSPMQEGDSIAPDDNTFGAATISRRLNAQPNLAFENCLIENLNLQGSQEDKFVRNASWLDFLVENQLQIFILLIMAVLALRFYSVLGQANRAQRLQEPLRPRSPAAMQTQPILDINVMPIHGVSFTNRLTAIDYDGKIPHEFLCPISCELMDDPAQLNDGHTYDYSSIMRWIEMQGESAKCPSNTSILITSITSNVTLRKLIDNFVSEKEADYAQQASHREHYDTENASSFSLRA